MSSPLDTGYLDIGLGYDFWGAVGRPLAHFGVGTPHTHTHTQGDRNGEMKQAPYLKKANLNSTEAKQSDSLSSGPKGFPEYLSSLIPVS